MRETLKDNGRLLHILDSIQKIEENKQKYSKVDIQENVIILFGFIKCLEIIGEAVYMLTKDFKESHKEVNWKQIEGMRHVLVHGYYTIDAIEVINAIYNDVPILKEQILKIVTVE